MKIIDYFKKRRTQYALNNQLPISQEKVYELIRDVVRETPSGFNSQSSRVVVLFDDEHHKLWEIVRETLRAIVPAENFAPTDEKITSFSKAAGSILFFEDQDVIKGLQEKLPTYADKFPVFSANSAGMAQFAVWTALANEKIRSEEHTSELQSRPHLVCRLLLEKKK